MRQSRSVATADVVLVNMPFTFLEIPAIGISLLKMELEQIGVTTALHYFTFSFAERVGVKLYNSLANQPGISYLAGEWVFNGALFDPAIVDQEGYVKNILRARAQGYGEEKRASEDFIEGVLLARSKVDAFLDDCLRAVMEHQPKVVGFTSVFQQHVASLALAKRIKEVCPQTLIVFGGPNCEDILGIETVRQFTFVDAVVLGEGDVVFPELVRRFLLGQHFTDLAGVYTAKSLGRLLTRACEFTPAPAVNDMDTLPLPMYEDYFQQLKQSHLDTEVIPEIPFETARGCWWGAKQHCTFCGINDLTISYRSKSSERALNDLIAINRRYPKYRIMGTDEILNMKYFQDLLPELVVSSLDLNLFYECKANLRYDQVKLMRDAGITSIQPGIESLSTTVLTMMRKGVTGLQNVQLMKWCEELGIICFWNFLWGFTNEPPEEYANMAQLVPLLAHLRPPDWMGLIALVRFSPYHNNPEQFAITDVKHVPTYDYIYPLEKKTVSNLAYYFTFRYQQEQCPDTYTAELAERVLAWRQAYRVSALFYEQLEDDLLIWDTRPCAREVLTVLSGIQRDLYLMCDSVCSVRRLRRACEEAREERPLEQLLEPLLEGGYMIHDNEHYLALAIPLNKYAKGRLEVEIFMRSEKRNMMDAITSVI